MTDTTTTPPPARGGAQRETLRELALFAGAGGGILGGHLLGWRCVCAVELEDYPRRVLLARQRDGMLPRFPIWDDVTTFDGHPWRGRVDVISGGFPCQGISAAGKGAGLADPRSGLWIHMVRIINEVRPRYCFVENSPMLVSRGIGTVLGDLARMGYDCRWGVFCSCRAGLLHHRRRIFILADSAAYRRGLLSDDRRIIQPRRTPKTCDYGTHITPFNSIPAPEFWGGSNGVPRWVGDGWRCVGNAQVPAVAALAWRVLA